jgi:c(7)-type cytochrome triheme protein
LIIGIAFAQTGVKIRRPLPYEYGRVVINNYSEAAHLSPVVFDHWLHRAKFTCRLCHIDVGFVIKAEMTDIRATDNMIGYYCGSCHDGKRVFEGEKIFTVCAENYTKNERKRCIRCHSKGSTEQRKYDYKTFTNDLPQMPGNLIDWEKAEADGKVKPIDFLEGISYKREPLAAQDDFSIKVITWASDVTFSHKKHTVWKVVRSVIL